MRSLMLVEPVRTSIWGYTLKIVVSNDVYTLIIVSAENQSKLHVIGSPVITSLLYERNTTLTCTSTGGPPTTVTWRKNDILVDNSIYEQSQRLVDAESATYENVLFNDNVTNFVGTFTCEVSNVRGSIEETRELNGNCLS